MTFHEFIELLTSNLEKNKKLHQLVVVIIYIILDNHLDKLQAQMNT